MRKKNTKFDKFFIEYNNIIIKIIKKIYNIMLKYLGDTILTKMVFWKMNK
jgi:hypothetical protein